MSERKPVNVTSLTLSAFGVLFVALKLTGHIDWSWWWVLAPFWMPLAIIMVLLMITGLLGFILWRRDRG